MAEQKQRSVFWVVSTHLLTTGFVMPLLARIFASIAISTMSLQFPVSGLILLASLVLGYIGGAFYSLSYIRKVAIVENPTACIMPSIIGFTVLAIMGLAANLAAQLMVMGGNTNGTITVVAMVGFYVVICVAFAMITRRGFAPRTEESSGES